VITVMSKGPRQLRQTFMNSMALRHVYGLAPQHGRDRRSANGVRP
jgi:hypothetical protein